MLILQGGRDYQVTVTDDLACRTPALDDLAWPRRRLVSRTTPFVFTGLVGLVVLVLAAALVALVFLIVWLS